MLTACSEPAHGQETGRPASRPLHRTLFTLTTWALLWAAAAPSAQAFSRLNALLSEVTAPGPQVDGLPGTPRTWPLAMSEDAMVGVLGDALLLADPERNRVLCLREGKITVFAGNGSEGAGIDPHSALRTALFRPNKLLVLADQSVLVCRGVSGANDAPGVQVLRIRTRVLPGQATVSLFAGNGRADGAIVPGPALAAPLGSLGGLAQERDGSVLLVQNERDQLLRIRPDGTLEVAAGTGAPGDHLDPRSGPLTQLAFPGSVAVLADDSILIADRGNDRVLRLRDGAVTVYAGTGLDAEHPMPWLGGLGPLARHPDGSVWLVERPGFEDCRLLRLGPAGVTLLGGQLPAQGGLELDPRFVAGLSHQAPADLRLLTALPDGSMVLGSERDGLLLLSPDDALQHDLEHLVNQGRQAVQAGDGKALRKVELDLAYLCAPSRRSFAAVNHAAHDLDRLEAMKPAGQGQAVPLKPVIRDLMREVHGYAAHRFGEALRAQLALKELRQFRCWAAASGF